MPPLQPANRLPECPDKGHSHRLLARSDWACIAMPRIILDS